VWLWNLLTLQSLIFFFFLFSSILTHFFQIKQRQEALRIQKEQHLIAKQQSILHSQPFVQDVEVSKLAKSPEVETI
jgi:hypothetical protein